MKKLIAILMAMALILCLAACGTDEVADNPGTPAANTDEPVQDSFAFTVNGVKIALHAPAAEIVAALGEYLGYSESPSCAFDGLDKTYVYSSFSFTTYPIGEKDYISSIWLQDDLVETDEGLTIGSSLADVQACFSADCYNGTNAYTVVKGHGKLEIKLEDEIVTDILFSATFE